MATGDGVPSDALALRPFADRQRQHGERADREGRGEQAARIDRRPQPQQRGVDRPADHAAQHHQVAEREVQAEQHAEVGAHDDEHHAGRRERDAEHLQHARLLAEQDEIGDEDHRRGRGLHQDRVRRGRVVQAEVKEAVEAGDAEQAERHHEAPMRAQHGPVALERGGDQRAHEQQSAAPALQRQRERRDVAGGEPAEDRVAGPGQHDDQQEDIGKAGAGGDRRRSVRPGGLVQGVHDGWYRRALTPPPTRKVTCIMKVTTLSVCS